MGECILDIKLPFGIRNNKLIHISQINENERGLKCNCYCPQCGQRLTAKLGQHNRHHFSHSNENCKNALETSLHLFAKDVLNKYKKIRLPEFSIINSVYYTKIEDFNKSITDLDELKKIKIVKESIIEFERIEYEKRLDSIIPDIIAYFRGVPLLIEIAVTHFIDSEKNEKIKKLGISAIEINLDLKEFNYYTFDKDKIEDLIINNVDCKKWIYNKIAENKKLNLIENNIKKLDELKKFEKEKQLRIQELIEVQLKNIEETLHKYEEEASSYQPWINLCKKYNINSNNIPEFINHNVQGSLIFECDKRIWQSFIFDKFIFNRKDKLIKVGNVVRWTEKYSPLPLNKEFIYTRNTLDNVSNLTSIILNYLLFLTNEGFLTKKGQYNKFYTSFIVIFDKFEIPDKKNSYEQSIESFKKTFINAKEEIVADKKVPPKSKIYEKLGKCTECGVLTSDWIIFNGKDNTCICRACRYK